MFEDIGSGLDDGGCMMGRGTGCGGWASSQREWNGARGTRSNGTGWGLRRSRGNIVRAGFREKGAGDGDEDQDRERGKMKGQGE